MQSVQSVQPRKSWKTSLSSMIETPRKKEPSEESALMEDGIKPDVHIEEAAEHGNESKLSSSGTRSIVIGAGVGALGSGAGGCALGAAAGAPLALFTFGLSIPIGAGVGASVGAASGAIGGGVVGHVVHRRAQSGSKVAEASEKDESSTRLTSENIASQEIYLSSTHANYL